jgi:hypothetical protein
MTFTAAHLGTLRAAFAGINRVNPERIAEFRAIFAKCNEATLEQLAGAGIKFVSKLAVNEQTRRTA